LLSHAGAAVFEVLVGTLVLELFLLHITNALAVSGDADSTAACLQASLFTAQPLCDSCHIFCHMLVLLCLEVFAAKLALELFLLHTTKALAVSGDAVSTAACLQASLFTALPLCDTAAVRSLSDFQAGCDNAGPFLRVIPEQTINWEVAVSHPVDYCCKLNSRHPLGQYWPWRLQSSNIYPSQ
jgi:hypothetical protein